MNLIDKIRSNISKFLINKKPFSDYYYTMSIDDHDDYYTLYDYWKRTFFNNPPEILGIVSDIEVPFSEEAGGRYNHLLNNLTVNHSTVTSDNKTYKAGRYKGLNIIFMYDDFNKFVIFDPIDRFSIFTL